MSRQTGRRLATVVLGLLLVGGLALAGRAGETPLLAGAGDVSAHAAVLWARAPGPGRLTWDLEAGPGAPSRRFTAEATAGADFTARRVVDGLAPATVHAYHVSWRDQTVSGRFVTAPAPGETAPVTLLWSGDLGGGGRCREPRHGYPIFRAMAARKPDLFLFVGDTIYADQRCPAPPNLAGSDFRASDLPGFRAKHRYNRADPAVQALLGATGVYAIWDDHEVRNDFAGPSEPLMPLGRQAFLEYWPVTPAPGEPGRLYRRARWGRLLELFILDTRQYRDPNGRADGPDKSMLGRVQREWLLAGLAESDATWKAVVSSVSLSIPTGRAGRDSWASGWSRPGFEGPPTGFEHELGRIVAALARARVRNLIWLVADVHRAEVIRHAPAPGVVFHELVAGPLSASLGLPGGLDLTLRPTRLYAEGGFDSFGELRATAAGLEIRIIDGAGEVRFQTRLLPNQ